MLNIARFDKLVKDLMSTTGRKEKESILSQYKDDDDVKEMLEYHFDIYKPSGISKKKLNKISNPEAFKNNTIDESYNILDLLRYLEVHRTGRIEDLNTVERYASALGPYAKLIYSLVCKDLRLGVQPITLNKIFGPGFIPTFDVMLAEKYYDAPDKYLPDGVDFILTTKLDGSRLVCIYEKDNIEFFSRQGQLIEGLNDIADEVSRYLLPGYVYDGELLLRNDNNLESKDLYRATVKVVNADGEKKNVIFNIFDMLPISDFKNGISMSNSFERKMLIHNLFNNCKPQWLKEVEMLYIGNNKDQIQKWLDKITGEGGEGVMINLSASPYECKRSRGILKVKKMQTCDLRVVGMEEGDGVNKGRLGALKVEFPAPDGKTYVVDVGGGYTFEDRDYFWNHKEDIIGKIIEIQYFEVSQNANGGYSLRFPVFLGVREDKDEPSMY